MNLGKYVSTMLAAGAKLAYEKEKSIGWLCLLVAMSSAATVYQLYWDFVKDWGLLQSNSRNPWLRNELMLRRKFIYYFSMVYRMIIVFFFFLHLSLLLMIHVKVVFSFLCVFVAIPLGINTSNPMRQIDRTKQVSLHASQQKTSWFLVTDMLQKLNSSPKKSMETSQSNL